MSNPTCAVCGRAHAAKTTAAEPCPPLEPVAPTEGGVWHDGKLVAQTAERPAIEPPPAPGTEA